MIKKHKSGVRRKPDRGHGTTYEWVSAPGIITVWGGGKYRRHKRSV